MKQLLIITIYVIFFMTILKQNVFSQDRIVLTSGDTIKCTITKVTAKYLYFSHNLNGITAKGKIPKVIINEWSSFPVKEEKVQTDFLSPETRKKIGLNPKFEEKKTERISNPLRISARYGVGYLLGNTDNAEQSLVDMGVSPNDSKDYYKQFVYGKQLKASVYYNIGGDFWLGALYDGFYSGSEITTTLPFDEVNMYFGRYGERCFVNFAAASYFSSTRFGKEKQMAVSSSFSIGPAFYRNEAEMLNEQILIQGKSLATDLSLGLEYFINPQWGINFESSLFTSHVKKITVTTTQSSYDVSLDKENYENLSRLDFSLGFVFYW